MALSDPVLMVPCWLDEGSGEWLAFEKAATGHPALRNRSLFECVPDRAGLVELRASPGAQPLQLWRRAYLRQIFESGVVPREAPVADVLSAASHHVLTFRPGHHPESLGASPPSGRAVLLISRFGVQKFGGAEHFVMQMARLYRRMGYDPIIVGTRNDRVGQTGNVEDIRYTFVQEEPDAMFRLAWQERAAIVHVVSGLGFEVAAALRFLDVRLIFGVHFWRELFHPPTANAGYYPNCPDGYERRPEFELLLSDADAVYVNSEFTQRVVENAFGVRTPILPSLPDETELAGPPVPESRDVVLLANARVDKGYGMLLRIAALLPQIRFVAIASQSSKAAAAAAAEKSGLSNIEVIGHVADMAPLYRRARVVVVPSYSFVETFSRVVIEAQRHGVPIIGSDRGNVPNLLRESGLSLPADPEAWAEEIRRLFSDPEYWLERSRRALRNSDSYNFQDQALRLSRLVAGLDAPILVGVGSGVGNVIHTTPLLRNLALRLGRPVDVVVAGDSAGALSVVANSAYVRHVFPLTDVVLRRRYQTVFITQCFGTIIPPFCAERVLLSRDWDVFEAGHAMHEAEFNLAAAAALLGVPYGEEDVRGCFVAELRHVPKPGRQLVGFHAGSKTGVWAAKRWPHFAELAERLKARGLAVASFGTPDEYVPGTEDLTGGSVEEMAQAMLQCSAFLANDSGVMNIANAIGLPLVALFAPTEPRTRGPLGARSLTIALRKDCAPCELAGSSGPFRRMECCCIAELPVETVEAAIFSVLAAES